MVCHDRSVDIKMRARGPFAGEVMSSDQRKDSAKSSDAYARAVKREEQQSSSQKDADDQCEMTDETETSDLFRQHSHQQTMEGG